MNKTLILLLSCFLISLAGFSQIGMKRIDDGILFTEGKNKIAFYKKDASGMNLDKGRSNYFHPLYLPDGTEITEDAPADHLHHRGLFWAWHRVLINGRAIGDGWELKDFIQDVKGVEFFRLSESEGVFKTIVEWKSPVYENGNKAFMEERATINFYAQKNNFRIIQFSIQLKALVDGLQLGGSDDEKGYGGFSVRMKLPEDVRFSSSNGLLEPTNEALEADDYVNISGSLAKKSGPGGVLIYSANDFETADKWILRRKNSMQNAVFPGREPVAVSVTEPTVLKYAVVLYSGEIKEHRIMKELGKLKWDADPFKGI